MQSIQADGRTTEPHEIQRKLYVVSAQDERALASRVNEACVVYIEHNPEMFEWAVPRNLAYTLGERRSVLPWKLALTAERLDDAVRQLSAVDLKFFRSTQEPKVGFVFTGQGSQWACMGQELLQYPQFQHALKRADRVLSELGAEFTTIGV